jgi:hypothetical protein
VARVKSRALLFPFSRRCVRVVTVTCPRLAGVTTYHSPHSVRLAGCRYPGAAVRLGSAGSPLPCVEGSSRPHHGRLARRRDATGTRQLRRDLSHKRRVKVSALAGMSQGNLFVDAPTRTPPQPPDNPALVALSYWRAPQCQQVLTFDLDRLTMRYYEH